MAKEKLQRHLKKVEQLERDQINIDVEREKMQQITKKVIVDLCAVEKMKVKAFEEYCHFLNNFDMQREKFSIFNQNNAEIEGQIRMYQQDLDKAKVHFN